MVRAMMPMKVLSEKRKELSKTTGSLSGSIRTEKESQPAVKLKSLKEEYHMKNIYSSFLITLVALLMFGALVHAQKKDSGIESSARQSYVFETDLKADRTQIKSADGDVTLTGSVSEEPHKLLAPDTVAGPPDVKSQDNRMEVKGARPGPAPPLRMRVVTETFSR